MPWTPQDFPFIVEKAARGYASVVEVFRTTPLAQQREIMLPLLEDSLDTLTRPLPLTWIDSEICELVDEMYDKVPDWSPEACIPAPEGMIAFEKPVISAPYESSIDSRTTNVPVSVLAWKTVGETVEITGWALQDNVPAEFISQLRTELRTGLEELLGVSVKASAIIDGSDRLAPLDQLTDRREFLDAGTALRSVAGAVWLLMSQPRSVRESDSAVARVKKRDKATGKKYVAPVRVSVTSLVQSPTAGQRGGAGRKATSRWWVRGHWRQQPWGKNRALRKPVWIAPHTAGAQDAEIDDRPQVQVWRSGETGRAD